MGTTDQTTNALNALIDVSDVLAAALTADDAWLKSVELVERFGGNALNVVEIERATGDPVWFRSSMDRRWLENYIAQDFVAFDSLILSAPAQDNRLLCAMISAIVQPPETVTAPALPRC